MGKEDPNWGKDRRQGLRAALGLATEPFFRGLFGEIVPEDGLNNVEIVRTFPYPHPDLALVNSSAIPKEYGIHHPAERILHTINYGEPSMGIYGPGIIEAASRGQKVTLTIEQPFGFKTSLSDWASYIDQIARIYQPVQFIVGNETNVLPHFIPPRDYFPFFITAKEIITRLSPGTEVLPAAEAYDGQAEYFDEFLGICDSLSIDITTVPFHFYGYPEELPQRIEILREICKRRHYPNMKLAATEMSRPENETLTEEELADFLYQTLVVSAQLLGSGLEFGAWFSGYDFGKGKGHTLFNSQDGPISPRPAFFSYLLASRLLHKVVWQEPDDSLTATHSLTADGIPVLSIWNQGNQPIERRIPRTHYAFDVMGNNLGGQVTFTRTEHLGRTAILIPKEAFGIQPTNKPLPV